MRLNTLQLNILVVSACLISMMISVDCNFPTFAQPRPTTSWQYQRYEVPGEFSVSIPINWSVQRRENAGPERRVEVTLMNQAPPRRGSGFFGGTTLIKTEILVGAGSFDTQVSRRLENNELSERRVLKRGKALVGGREAYREVGNYDDGDGYTLTLIYFTETETLLAISYYAGENKTAEKVAQQLHGSIRVLR